MSFYASLGWYPPVGSPWIWAVAGLLAVALAAVVWRLREAGWRRPAIVLSLVMVALLLGLGIYVEVAFWIERSVPVLTGPPSGPGSDGTTIDNDGAVRLVVAVAAFFLPFILLGVLGVLAGWMLPFHRRRAAKSIQVGTH